jgi:DNA-binding MarR family transcriptional regulator
MNSWNLLQLNIRFYQNAMIDAEQGLAKLYLEVKSFFLLSALEHIWHPTELAKHLFIPKPTVSFILKRLESRGYIKRNSVPSNLRMFELRLTSKGQKTLDEGRRIMNGVFEKYFSRLTIDERNTYASLITKLAG